MLAVLNFFIVIFLVGLRIYAALAIFKQYRDLETVDNKSLKS